MDAQATNRRRGAVDRNVILLAVSGVLLVGAGVIVFAMSGSEASKDSAAVNDAMMTVRCSECGESWKMRYAEWKAKSAAATAAGATGIVCEKCGKATAWHGGLNMSNLKPPSQKDIDSAWSNTDGTAPPPEDYGEDDEYEDYADVPKKEPPKPAMSAVRD